MMKCEGFQGKLVLLLLLVYALIWKN